MIFAPLADRLRIERYREDRRNTKVFLCSAGLLAILRGMEIKVVAVPSVSQRGRWHFATKSTLRPGMSLSLRTWATKRGAILAGRREHNVKVGDLRL